MRSCKYEVTAEETVRNPNYILLKFLLPIDTMPNFVYVFINITVLIITFHFRKQGFHFIFGN